MSRASGTVLKPSIHKSWDSIEPPATILYDDSRFHNHGTFRADGQPNWVRNEFGTWVMELDGNNDYVDFGNDPSLYPERDLSIFTWVKLKSYLPVNYPRLLGSLTLDGGDWKGFGLYITAAGNIALELNTVGLGGLTQASWDIISLDRWYHFGWTYDGAYVRKYTNGALVGAPGAVTGNIQYVAAQANFRIANCNADTVCINGYQSRPFLARRALTTGEVEIEFNNHRRDYGL